CVNVVGKKDSSLALLCWGSNKGVCAEVGEAMGLRVVQPVVLSPFPVAALTKALEGVTKVIAVENNATGQLARLARANGLTVHERISKYDGRSFSPEELEAELGKIAGAGRSRKAARQGSGRSAAKEPRGPRR
ncbi:MAG: hypothetical protein V2A71_03825, partial [Candidatus Eisenbacteria bacterium]